MFPQLATNHVTAAEKSFPAANIPNYTGGDPALFRQGRKVKLWPFGQVISMRSEVRGVLEDPEKFQWRCDSYTVS